MKSLAGSFLVARSILRDPNFAQSVVLLLQHGTEGAFGLVVNRPVDLEGLPVPLYLGGPCKSDGLLMVHGYEDWTQLSADNPVKEIAPGIYLGDSSCVNKVSELPEGADNRYRMYTGYSGWGPDQLERELAEGAWMVIPATGELLFDTPTDELWDKLMPPQLPQPSLN